FIVITGEVGAGKTTLVRNLFCKLESQKIVAAQIVNTHLDSDNTLRMVVSAFGLPYEDANKTVLLTRLEQFLRQCDKQGKRALLVVDEAQNLTPQTVEELRMLSNFQTDDKSLLQTFLLGQPEFRRTLHSAEMEQLRQRVIATYHLGPMDALETKAYIEHRLHTAGWHGDPSLDSDAYTAIYEFTGGIPRKINTFCDRLFLMGYLEEIHDFTIEEINKVIGDIRQEFDLPYATESSNDLSTASQADSEQASVDLEKIDERLAKMERSVVSVLDALKKIVSAPKLKHPRGEK
ncbi:MAG: XrtA/PEP-CTERM system-associated ATPase, partial [Burkholderiaceae bacterium]